MNAPGPDSTWERHRLGHLDDGKIRQAPVHPQGLGEMAVVMRNRASQSITNAGNGIEAQRALSRRQRLTRGARRESVHLAQVRRQIGLGKIQQGQLLNLSFGFRSHRPSLLHTQLETRSRSRYHTCRRTRA